MKRGPAVDRMRIPPVFSPCRGWRYTLWRHWGDLFEIEPRYAMFIGLNPSTADEERDDNTIRRCIDYAQRWGYSALCMTNLFAWRATQPEDMKAQPDPVGPENDAHLLRCAAGAGLIVAAWGNDGAYLDRAARVRELIPDGLHALRMTGEGQPWHPLYLPKNLTPFPLVSERANGPTNGLPLLSAAVRH